MATKTVVTCDLCGSDADVHDMTVIYQYGKGKPWEIDLCSRCFEGRMRDMADLGRRAKISNVRPQARIKETKLTPANL